MFYWDGLRERRLLLQRCDDCARFRFPPMSRCPYCASAATSVHQASGRGTIYSWIVVHRAFDLAFAGDVPYTIATVDFDEGVRMALRVEDPGVLDFGVRVRATYTPHETWTELRVVPEVRDAQEVPDERNYDDTRGE